MDTIGLVTADELAAMGHDAERFELVRGRMVRMNPTSAPHARIAAIIAARLVTFVEAGGLGTVLVKAGFMLTADPDSVRGPDVSFVRAGRVPALPPRGFVAGPPDLAVEVKSPHDTMPELLAKAGEYLAAGAALVWVIDPETQTATVFAAGDAPRQLGANDALDGAPTLPGFSLPLAGVFKRR